MIRRAAACDRHRPALLDFVDRGERGPDAAAAFDHLSTCDLCERELTEIALAIVALRRVRDEAQAVPVPVVSGERVARLMARRADPWRWRLQLGSLLASAAIAAIVVAPRVGVGPSAAGAVSLMPDRPAPAATWRAAEDRIAAAPDNPPVAQTGTLPLRYPEGQSRPWKEVLPTDAMPREFEPL